MTELRELIADRIRTSGPISFAEFMELSLYHPELGYYARAARKTGRAGDFFTSVDVGPVFGEFLARQFAEMWRIWSMVDGPSSIVDRPSSIVRPSSSVHRPSAIVGEKGDGSLSRETSAKKTPVPFFDLVEVGASDGRLARDILDAAARNDPDFYAATRLSLVERSHAARAEHVTTLGPHAARLNYTDSALPEDVDGIIFANELLDAFPTHAVAMTESGLQEVFVDFTDGRFVERFRTPSTPRIAEYLARAGAVMHQGFRAEVNLAAEDWIKTAATSLRRGFLIIIDYGHEEDQLYGGSHSSGTLTTFKRHTLMADFLDAPGECDITAHVDLSAVTRTAEQAGLDVLGRLDQTYFLLGLGVDDLEHMPLHDRLAVKTLLLPGGLGSTHKVLIFGKGMGHPALKGCSYRERMT
jgi:SAM-dependent MidA family methyltransferase